MSGDGDNEAVAASCCASCGIAEIDDVKLVPCDGCDLVKYCSDECREEHRPQHAEDCKKRAAELRDELLFKQPATTHLGDCPICCLPLPIDVHALNVCCSKIICQGCDYSNKMREKEMRLAHSCPFCREALPKTDEGVEKQNMKRVEMNDPAALCHQGMEQRKRGDYNGAFEYLSKAAKLGDVEAHYRMSALYRDGEGVEQDRRKEIYHMEEAAIGGHPKARLCLGCKEMFWGDYESAVKHYIIAATQGEDGPLKLLMDLFKGGIVSKEDLAATLRAQKAAVDATKSAQRVAAKEYYRKKNTR